MNLIGSFLIGVALVGFVWLELEDRARGRRLEQEARIRMALALRNATLRKLVEEGRKNQPQMEPHSPGYGAARTAGKAGMA